MKVKIIIPEDSKMPMHSNDDYFGLISGETYVVCTDDYFTRNGSMTVYDKNHKNNVIYVRPIWCTEVMDDIILPEEMFKI